jgi:hypothetical protein
MEQLLAEQKANQLKIDTTQVVREYWELIILKGLFESPMGRFLIFKGGTALRLTYDSPRFSEDLDFSMTKDSLKQFSSLMKDVSPFSNLVCTDLQDKFCTYLAKSRSRKTTYLSHFGLRWRFQKEKRRVMPGNSNF